ncbi:efflux RND transporter periplasmic adaptor subunit [Paenibacillus tengchongensis]|uniref:efflux RND transporter periplasmic adaptor subunit n=1 Tax=Paenibacillus tengchongensis TaxID=2608684 RepID=UPI0016526AA6|nr:efflux RND transporter periplasmic adaptor subunit [Paenibacillus tengchongensis]
MSQSTRSIAALLGGLLLALSLPGCSLLPAEDGELQPPLVKPAQENYRTAAAKKGTITKELGGNGNFVSVSTEAAQYTGQGGRIDKIAVSAGDRVHKGDVVAQLTLDGMDLQLKEQELALERAKYAYKNTPKEDADARRIASLQMEIEELKYNRLKAQFDSKIITAAIDGQVTFAESLTEGDPVEPYQTLVVISDPTKLRLALSIDPGTDLSKVDVGTGAEVTVDKQTYQAKVVQTPGSAPVTLNKELVDKNARTLYLDVEGLPEDVEIGSLADVRIITQQRDDVIVIPKNGLRTFMGRSFVRVLEEGSRLREVDVEAGITGSTEVEIVKGLEEGAVVVLQ